MLTRLHIENFAVIEDMTLEFSAGLNILTGETGAGKSILIEALGFLLGARGSSSWLREKGSRLQVEGAFDREDFSAELRTIYKLSDSPVTVRRELDSGGKTRASLNGTSVPVSTLAAFGDGVVDFHGQHEHQSLLKSSAQLEFLDRYAAHESLLEETARRHGAWSVLAAEREALEMSEAERSGRMERLGFEVEDIEAAAPRPGEEEELEASLPLIKNADKIRELAGEAYQRLYGGEGSALAALTRSERALSELARIDPGLEDSRRAIESAAIAVEEIGRGLARYGDPSELRPERVDDVYARLETLSRLKRKYGATVSEILERARRSRQELASLENWEDRMGEIEEDFQKAEKALLCACDRLHKSRVKAGACLETAVGRELKVLGMPHARFSVALEMEEGRFTVRGSDDMELLISVNPGQPLKPVKNVASGGELSRVMLALKTVLAKSDRIPVLVFDEVDAGIGGGVARAVGARLGKLGAGHQVLCVTHLAQVACFGRSHFNVIKEASGRGTDVRAERLEGPRRLEAIAWMLGGREVTAASRKHAKELLESSSAGSQS